MSETQQEFATRRRREYIAALEQELEGYKRYKNKDRARDVEQELESERAALKELEQAAAARAAAAATGAETTPVDAEPGAEYAKRTVKELEELVGERGVAVAGKTKQDLVDALVAADAAAAAPDGES